MYLQLKLKETYFNSSGSSGKNRKSEAHNQEKNAC